jgi:hypothetical protein
MSGGIKRLLFLSPPSIARLMGGVDPLKMTLS